MYWFIFIVDIEFSVVAFTILKRTIHQFLADSRDCACITTINFRTSIGSMKAMSLSSHSSFPPANPGGYWFT